MGRSPGDCIPGQPVGVTDYFQAFRDNFDQEVVFTVGAEPFPVFHPAVFLFFRIVNKNCSPGNDNVAISGGITVVNRNTWIVFYLGHFPAVFVGAEPDDEVFFRRKWFHRPDLWMA